MSEQDRKEEFIKKLREIINDNRGLDVEFLMHEQDPIMLRTYAEFLDVINKGDYNEETLQFLRGCYKTYEIFKHSFCGCVELSYIRHSVNILIMENMLSIPISHTLDWNEKAEILNISEEYMSLLYYVLNRQELLEHGSPDQGQDGLGIRYSWLAEKGKYILDETYDIEKKK